MKLQKPRIDVDGALKDLFQRDRPTLLNELTGGVAIQEFLNVELPKVLERRVDLLLLLVDGSILHIEIQSTNLKKMGFRMLMYHALLAELHPSRRLRHLVLYVGEPAVRMSARLDTGHVVFEFEVVDIRQIDAGSLLRSGKPADCALALLAGGGLDRVPDILASIGELKAVDRARALALMALLCGLRTLPVRLKAELANMGVQIDISKSPLLMAAWERTVAEIMKEAHEAEQQASLNAIRSLHSVVRSQLRSKFGRIPKWAGDRLAAASVSDLEKWAKKIIPATTLEEVIGKR